MFYLGEYVCVLRAEAAREAGGVELERTAMRLRHNLKHNVLSSWAILAMPYVRHPVHLRVMHLDGAGGGGGGGEWQLMQGTHVIPILLDKKTVRYALSSHAAWGSPTGLHCPDTSSP